MYIDCVSMFPDDALCGIFRRDLVEKLAQVKLAAYAPLFAHVQHVAWTPNLIYHSNDGCFVNPSWNVQKLFSENRGAEVLKETSGDFALAGSDTLPPLSLVIYRGIGK